MRKVNLVLVFIFAVTMLLTSCGNKEQKVTCTICNGAGQVKYYYGDGDNDYNM